MIKNISEYKFYTEIDDDELMEMSNISPKTTGIENVVIWVGPNPHYHGKRIKVSNVPNKFSKDDCFTVTFPDLEVIGSVNKSLIDSEKLKKIKKFIIVNMEVLTKYSNGEIFTDDMITMIKKV